MGEETQAASQQDRPLSSSRVPLVALMLESRAKACDSGGFLLYSCRDARLGTPLRNNIRMEDCLLSPLQYCILLLHYEI